MVSPKTGNKGGVFVGWSLGLPDQAHELILSSNASEILEQKKFFLPYERHMAADKLLADLQFSKRLKIIPVYFDALPESDQVYIVLYTTINLPVLDSDKVTELSGQLKRWKRKLNELLHVNQDSIMSLLNVLKDEIENIELIAKSDNFIELQIYCLEFSSAFLKEIHFAFVVKGLEKIDINVVNNPA